MLAYVKLESAASRSWTRANGVRDTTRPPASYRCHDDADIDEWREANEPDVLPWRPIVFTVGQQALLSKWQLVWRTVATSLAVEEEGFNSLPVSYSFMKRLTSTARIWMWLGLEAPRHSCLVRAELLTHRVWWHGEDHQTPIGCCQHLMGVWSSSSSPMVMVTPRSLTDSPRTIPGSDDGTTNWRYLLGSMKMIYFDFVRLRVSTIEGLGQQFYFVHLCGPRMSMLYWPVGSFAAAGVPVGLKANWLENDNDVYIYIYIVLYTNRRGQQVHKSGQDWSQDWSNGNGAEVSLLLGWRHFGDLKDGGCLPLHTTQGTILYAVLIQWVQTVYKQTKMLYIPQYVYSMSHWPACMYVCMTRMVWVSTEYLCVA